MLKKILRCLLEFIINEWLIQKIVFIYKRLFEEKIRKAVGKVSLSNIKHQGVNCKFHGDVKVYYDDGLTLGDNVRVGFGSFFFALGGISIGSNTQISRNVIIYSANHNVEGNAIPYDDQYSLKPVTIGKSVWIGMNVMILPGVVIGDGAIIGMGAVISKNIEPGDIVVGATQRKVKQRDLEKFKAHDEKGHHFGDMWPDK